MPVLPAIDRGRLDAAASAATAALLAERNEDGYWAGDLSSSALSTATAVTALIVAVKNQVDCPLPPIRQGLDWLVARVNADGGWGDTTKSISNISTTALVWAALGAGINLFAEFATPALGQTIAHAERWLQNATGLLTPEFLAAAITRRYGKDRTFSVPILMSCALAGRFGLGAKAWEHVKPLPFELAALPRSWFAAARLPVVSYALPALIAIGRARHFHRPSRNPLTRFLRQQAEARTLRVLSEIQPDSGGFLEATPLTSFVAMALAGSGRADHPVTGKSLVFILNGQRSDGSWPIDTNLATWATTLAVNALSDGEGEGEMFPSRPMKQWLLRQQYRAVHLYTGASPGGWAWTDLPGGVPDADDTAGAAVALRHLASGDAESAAAAVEGIRWLLDLQNRDGGIPTFCRGWGNLPFDRSGPDLTAHALRAWACWWPELSEDLRPRVGLAMRRANKFLQATQRKDGSWVPLWFGNQFEPEDLNPTYGTARIVRAFADLIPLGTEVSGLEATCVERGVRWILDAQDTAGGWSGFAGGPVSVEETSLAVEALAKIVSALPDTANGRIMECLGRGANWLVEQVEAGTWQNPSPIGFYFAKLWYFEKLYPQIFAVGALKSVQRLMAGPES